MLDDIIASDLDRKMAAIAAPPDPIWTARDGRYRLHPIGQSPDHRARSDRLGVAVDDAQVETRDIPGHGEPALPVPQVWRGRSRAASGSAWVKFRYRWRLTRRLTST